MSFAEHTSDIYRWIVSQRAIKIYFCVHKQSEAMKWMKCTSVFVSKPTSADEVLKL